MVSFKYISNVRAFRLVFTYFKIVLLGTVHVVMNNLILFQCARNYHLGTYFAETIKLFYIPPEHCEMVGEKLLGIHPVHSKSRYWNFSNNVKFLKLNRNFYTYSSSAVVFESIGSNDGMWNMRYLSSAIPCFPPFSTIIQNLK